MNRAAFIVLLALPLAPCVARADGGVVRAQAMAGPFLLTLFTPREVCTAVPADVTVLVQNRTTGEVVMDAAVEFRFTAPPGVLLATNTSYCGPLNSTVVVGLADTLGQSPSIRATRAHSANRLLHGANVLLPVVGDWRVEATIRQRGATASITSPLPVAAPPRRLAALWPYLALPPLAIALFALNQWLRRRTAVRDGS